MADRERLSNVLRALSITFTLVMVFAAPAIAGISISPKNPRIDAPAISASITVANTEATTMTVRMLAYRWSTTTQTSAIRFYPAIFTLTPNEVRVVRVGLMTSPTAKEQGYRVQAIPITTPSKTQMRVITSDNVPLFVAGVDASASPHVDVRTARLPHGYRVTVANAGGAHILLSRVELRSGAKVFSAPGWYVLADRSKSFVVSAPCMPNAAVVLQEVGGLEISSRAPASCATSR